MTYPRSFNHIGISVPDIGKAVAWYRDILGFSLVSGPYEIDHSTLGGEQAVNVLGFDFRRMRMAHMAAANGVGIELFQLIDPPYQAPGERVEYWKGGIFHLCITDPDIEGLTKRIVESGGRQLSKIWQERPPSVEHRMVYCADPFGIVIEIYTHSYEAMQGWR